MVAQRLWALRDEAANHVLPTILPMPVASFGRSLDATYRLEDVRTLRARIERRCGEGHALCKVVHRAPSVRCMTFRTVSFAPVPCDGPITTLPCQALIPL